MRQLIYVILAIGLMPLAGTAQMKKDTLTNEKVIQLSKLGLQSSVIINKIETSYTAFDVSTDGLIQLSTNGVSAEVINKMMNINHASEVAVASEKDMNDPLTHRATGIYYYDPDAEMKKVRRVDPNVVSTSKSGGLGVTIAFVATKGIAKEAYKSELAGKRSNLQIKETQPEFYFYFDEVASSNDDSWFFATASSPNEFVLVSLDEKKASREMAVGDMNAFGGSTGIPNKVKVPFSYEEMASGVYKVTFKTPLKKGEYCFIYASSTPTRYSNNKVFDFGIQNED